MSAKHIFGERHPRGEEPRRAGEARVLDRRMFLKGLFSTGAALLLPRCNGTTNSPSFCTSTETPLTESGSRTVMSANARMWRLAVGETSPVFAKYKVRLDEITEIDPPEGQIWQRDVHVTIFDEWDRMVDTAVLNPSMIKAWVSPTGVILSSYFAIPESGGDEWAYMQMYDPNAPVAEAWITQKLRVETQQAPDCVEVVTEEKITGALLAFSPGLPPIGFNMLSPMDVLGEMFKIGEVLPPSISPDGRGSVLLFKNMSQEYIFPGESKEVGPLSIEVQQIAWDDSGLFAMLQISDESGVLVGSLRMNSEETAEVGDYTIFCMVGPNGMELSASPYVFSGPVPLIDGGSVEINGKGYSVSMDSSPLGEKITEIRLDAEE